MSVNLVLQLYILLVGLYQVHCAHLSDNASTLQQAGEVPVSQLRMLSLGLAHLLHGVEENTKRLEQQGRQVAAKLDEATDNLESLHKQSLQAARTRRQARKDLQILNAKGDRLQRVVRDMLKGLEDLEAEQRAMQYRISWIQQKVKSLTEPRSGAKTPLNISSVTVIMDKQARQLASLTSEVSAQDRLIDRRLRHIEQFEKEVCYHFKC